MVGHVVLVGGLQLAPRGLRPPTTFPGVPGSRDLEGDRSWLAADRSGRESIASQALKRRTEGSAALSEFIAMLTTHPEQHERFMRVLGQIDGEGD
jgi:hypothetical protein